MQRNSSMGRINTVNRQKILDCAEELFALSGYDGVSVRAITSRAEVDVSQVNYYFGTKDGLFEEVMLRRADRMSQARMRAISGLNLSGDLSEERDKLNRTILKFFINPLFGDSQKARKELSNYRKLIALVANSKRWQDSVFKEHYDPIVECYIDALCLVNSHLSRDDICWAFNFFLGSLTNAIAETGRIDRLSRGSVQSSDLDLMIDRLIDFATGAFAGMSIKASQYLVNEEGGEGNE